MTSKVRKALEVRRKKDSYALAILQGDPDLMLCLTVKDLDRTVRSALVHDLQAKGIIEKIAMEEAAAKLKGWGFEVEDVSLRKVGFDLLARKKKEDAVQEVHVEVKGRWHSKETVTLTRNEIDYAYNHPDSFVLVIVRVGPKKVESMDWVYRIPLGVSGTEVSRNYSIVRLVEGSGSCEDLLRASEGVVLPRP